MTAGTVNEVHSKDWKNGIFMWHFTLDGSPRVYNCGSADPDVGTGENIQFEERNRKVLVDSIIRVSKEVADATPKPDPTRTGSAQPATPPSPATDVGTRIRRQEARRDAIRLVTTAMNTDLLPYPKSGKGIDKWNRMLDLINETTNDLLEQEAEWTTRST
jgi:hypothetical protein